MSQHIDLTPSGLAVFLITQRCLTQIFTPDAPVSPPPVAGRTLSAEERAGLGLGGTAGTTLGFLAVDVEVYLDLAGASAAVWFANGDFLSAPSLLELMLAQAFKPEDITVHKVAPPAGMQAVVTEYNIAPVGSRRAALLRVTVGQSNAGPADRMFVARIFPHEAVLN